MCVCVCVYGVGSDRIVARRVLSCRVRVVCLASHRTIGRMCVMPLLCCVGVMCAMLLAHVPSVGAWSHPSRSARLLLSKLPTETITTHTDQHQYHTDTTGMGACDGMGCVMRAVLCDV